MRACVLQGISTKKNAKDRNIQTHSCSMATLFRCSLGQKKLLPQSNSKVAKSSMKRKTGFYAANDWHWCWPGELMTDAEQVRGL